jgi:hypothetical protein
VKQLEYLYFTIYHHYSRRSYFPDDLTVRLQAMYILSLSAGGWILFLQASYLRLVRQVWFSSSSTAMMFAISVYLIIAALFHRIFIVQEYDQRIFNKYAGDWEQNPNKKRDLLICLLVAAVPYLLLISLKLFFPRPDHIG